ncbi:Alginate biosynthesis transcriptional regulatory protein AlgB [compost metagenome]
MYYRLNIFPINIPPLRDRREDIRVLAEHFLRIFNNKYDKDIKIEDNAYELLCCYKWVGNIRELQNIIERIVLISNKDTVIFRQNIISLLGLENIEPNIKNEMSLKEKVEELEKLELIKAFKIGKTTRKVAEMLKINQSNVVRKAKKYGLDFYDA